MPPRHPLLVALEPVAAAVGATLVGRTRVRGDDIPLEWEGEVVGGFRLPSRGVGIGSLIEEVEADVGPLETLSREDKQRVVALLDERGAFAFRRSVEQVADSLGVSRFTVYNYLNARKRPD